LRGAKTEEARFKMKNGMILWAVSGVAAVGLAVACSSSSGGGSSPGPDAGNEDSGSSSGGSSGSSSGSSSGGGDAAPMAMCTGTSDCTTAGQVCCGTFSGGMPGAACQAGPCPALPVVGAIQLCSAASDCTAPAVCGPNATLDALEPGLKTCAAPAGDGGSTGDSGSDAAPVSTDAGGDAADGG
jgi:hypothetical protein